MTIAEATFTPPGPGTWQFDAAHFSRPLTPWAAEVFGRGFSRGFAHGLRRYGMLLDRFEFAPVSGWSFLRAVPAPESELPARFETNRRALESRLWREDLARWDGEVKPDSIRRHLALQSVDLAARSDADLATHLAACLDHHAEMVMRHHQFNVAALLPVGIFVARAADWTGRSTGELLGLLRGSTPESAGVAAAELQAVREALRRAGIGRTDALCAGDAACVLERLRTLPGEVGEAVRAYLDVAGVRVTSGYDVIDRTAAELPSVHLEAIWADENAPGEQAGEAARLDDVRSAVPAEHRAEFDALLAEARLVNRLRDERGLYNDLWAAGIARRAIQEAGRRLALRGVLDEADQIFQASAGEMMALLRGAATPGPRELAARASERQSISLREVPAFVGDPPQPPPATEGLPPHVQLAARAIGVAVEEVLGQGSGDNEAALLRGKGVSAGVYEGPARVIAGPADFDRLRPGDVLVATSTNAAFNVVLPLLGAIVTDRGALLSHAAIVAREFGLPAVVGTRDATGTIADGARVRVDGTRGTVEVLR